jgi:hypothetical protein
MLIAEAAPQAPQPISEYQPDRHNEDERADEPYDHREEDSIIFDELGHQVLTTYT